MGGAQFLVVSTTLSQSRCLIPSQLIRDSQEFVGCLLHRERWIPRGRRPFDLELMQDGVDLLHMGIADLGASRRWLLIPPQEVPHGQEDVPDVCPKPRGGVDGSRL